MIDFASRIVVLAKGEIVEQGPPSEILENPQHPETKRLLQGE